MRLKNHDYIDNTVLRERYQALAKKEGLTMNVVAERLGWVTKDKTGYQKPDSSRVARMLGVSIDNGKYRQTVAYHNAVEICKALHLDYTDVGI